MYNPRKRIQLTNETANVIENNILEGIANKRFAPQYHIQRNFDDGEVEAWVQRIIPLNKIIGTVTLKKPLPDL